ncbi:T-cell receptor alpha chain V region CTL-L17, partial [Tinamus guttatus]
SVFLSSFSTAAAGKAQIQQEPSAETTEGKAVNITCSHPNIQSYDYIQWYCQLPGRGPTFIGSTLKDSKAVSEPAGTLLVGADRRSSALHLSQPRWRDAALYYCAV